MQPGCLLLQREMLASFGQLLILLLVSFGRALEPFAMLSAQQVALLLACAPMQPDTFAILQVWQAGLSQPQDISQPPVLLICMEPTCVWLRPMGIRVAFDGAWAQHSLLSTNFVLH